MFTAAFLVVVIGCATAQPKMHGKMPHMPGGMPHMPGSKPDMPGNMPHMPGNMPAIPWVSEGCDLQSMQSCLTTFMESGLAKRSMGMMQTSKVTIPDLDEVCQTITQLVKCIQPAAKSCGPQIASVASTASEAINYMCVDARSETQKYMQCMARDNNAAKMTPCVLNMVQEETAMLKDMRDPRAMIGRLCGLVGRYEQCVERKAGSLCNDEAYVKHIFGYFNKGLSFLKCKGLSQGGQNKPFPVPELPVEEGEVSPNRYPMGELQRTMRCMQTTITSCMSPHMALFFRAQTASKLSVDLVCSEAGTLKDCLGRSEMKCGPQARRMIETMKKVYNYLCFEKKEEFKESFSCLTRDMTSIVNSCANLSNSMGTRGDFDFERAEQSPRMREQMCSAIGLVGSCVSRQIERRCGYKARNLFDGLQFDVYDLMNAQFGIECRPDDSLPIVEPPEFFGRRHHHHHVLKIVLPIVGAVVVLVVIVALIVAIRRRHGAVRRQQLEKADLVKNDVLQENLKFAITQTPKEKSEKSALEV